ncbi:unnamed protein product [Polarella glacialis]|uniref:Reverse transcriptase domain-containing protein n=1 Tax=Polarella glacialis TaxID=89957 RepID=A0A813M0N9_POLGL|nr:unnamed protein product [Polarella glacialis]
MPSRHRGRSIGRTMGRDYLWRYIFADDIVLLAGGEEKWISILLAIATRLMFGTPLAWRKFRGGLTTDWVGYYLDLMNFSVGISLARFQWFAKWAVQVHRDGVADMRRFAEALGRLGFAAQVHLWAKPFLAPLYVWSAAAPSEAIIRVPKMVWENHGEWFRTDAKCDDFKVVLGRWVCKNGTQTSQGKWFSLELGPAQAPWLFKEGRGSSCASTSAEMLGTMVAIQAFGISCDAGGFAFARISAGTDNQANDSLSKERSTLWRRGRRILMELTTSLSRRRLQLNLDWRPREENQGADDLTNRKFEDFDEALRVKISWDEVDKVLLEKLLICQGEYEEELMALKTRAAAASVEGPRIKKRNKDDKTVWG